MAKITRRLRGVSDCMNALLNMQNAGQTIYVSTEFQNVSELNEVIMQVLVTKKNDTFGYINLRFRSQDPEYISYAVGNFFGGEDSKIKIAVMFGDDTLESMTVLL